MEIKKIVPLAIAFILVIIFAVKVFQSLDAGDHRPSSIFPSEENEQYVEDLFGYEE